METLMARPTVGPPSIQLRSNLSNVVAAELISVDSDHNLSFKKIKDIHNTTETDTITISADADLSDSLQTGQRYIIAYIAWISLRQPKVVKPRPGGAVLISMTGAEPAVFAYNEDIENMLSLDMDDSLNSPKEMLPLIMRGVQHADEAVQNFFMAEAVLRSNIYQYLDADDALTLLQMLDSPTTSDRVKELIFFEPAFLQALSSDTAHVCSALQKLLAYSSTDLNLQGRRAGVIRSALIKAQSCPPFENTDIISRWVMSNVPSVIEAALEHLHTFKAGSDLQAVEKALQQSVLSKNNREVLHNYRRRMMRTGSKK